ncbi:hypothetical protein MTP99_009318 [Tenebrio molitor]|nr:hypothetical protein MTP99_009318 [Tenebrio molitor]
MGSAAVIPDNLWRNSSVEESYVGKEVTGGRNSDVPKLKAESRKKSGHLPHPLSGAFFSMGLGVGGKLHHAPPCRYQWSSGRFRRMTKAPDRESSSCAVRMRRPTSVAWLIFFVRCFAVTPSISLRTRERKVPGR